jgi:hypothetical protein
MSKNSEEPDEDILEILLLLHIVPFNVKTARQKINKGAVLKKTISATLALLDGSNKAEMWRKHNKIGVSTLKDLLVSKYSNSLPQKCDTCDNIYQCHDATDMHRCISCDVGFCPDCCPHDGIMNQHFFPLCSPCVRTISSRAAITVPPSPEIETPNSTPANNVSTPPPNPSIEEDEAVSDEAPESLDEETPRADSQTPSDPSVVASPASTAVNPKICSFFAKNICKHGSKGVGCTHSHPKICHKWRKKGAKGCSKGKNCEYTHIKLCRSAVKGEECNNTKCNLPHLANHKVMKHTITIRKTQDAVKSSKVAQPGGRPTSSVTSRAETRNVVQDFQHDHQTKAPDVVILGLLEAVHLLGEQMKEIMRTRSQGQAQYLTHTPPPPQYSGGAVYYPQLPPPPHQQQQGYQAFPYHLHQQQKAVVAQPSH